MRSKSATKIAAFLTVALPALVAAGPAPAWRGTPVDLELEAANIKNVLRLLGEVERVNIWSSDDVKGRVSVRVKAVPWDEVLDQICRERRLQWQRNDNVVLVSGRPLPPARTYSGKRMNPDFTGRGKGLDIRAAMAVLGNVGQVAIAVDDNVRATIDMKGENMPWDQVLDVLLWSTGLRSERQGRVIRVLSMP